MTILNLGIGSDLDGVFFSSKIFGIDSINHITCLCFSFKMMLFLNKTKLKQS